MDTLLSFLHSYQPCFIVMFLFLVGQVFNRETPKGNAGVEIPASLFFSFSGSQVLNMHACGKSQLSP